MGYVYTNDGRLCCDYCGQPGAWKYRCPYNSCPATAACAKCRKEHTVDFGRAAHATCKEHSERHAEERRRTAELQAMGKPVRCSALNAGEGRVHVIFSFGENRPERVAYYMATEVYRTISIHTPATPEDYAALGELTPAPGQFT